MDNKPIDNPLTSVFQFYLDIAEKSAPVVKQGIEDYFTIYTKFWTESLKMQTEWYRQFTGNREAADVAEQVKESVEKSMEIQKDVATNVMDTAVKSVRSVKAAANKSKA